MKCDKCGKEAEDRDFVPETMYLGPRDPNDTSCDWWTELIFICEECNGKRELND